MRGHGRRAKSTFADQKVAERPHQQSELGAFQRRLEVWSDFHCGQHQKLAFFCAKCQRWQHCELKFYFHETPIVFIIDFFKFIIITFVLFYFFILFIYINRHFYILHIKHLKKINPKHDEGSNFLDWFVLLCLL